MMIRARAAITMIAHSVTQIANGTRRFRCMFGQIQNAVRFSVPHRKPPERGSPHVDRQRHAHRDQGGRHWRAQSERRLASRAERGRRKPAGALFRAGGYLSTPIFGVSDTCRQRPRARIRAGRRTRAVRRRWHDGRCRADLAARLQACGNRLQEGVAGFRRQRLAGQHDGRQFVVGETDRLRHAGLPWRKARSA